MSVLHVKGYKVPYVQIPIQLQNDKRLSWKAMALASYLCPKPESWEVRIGDLVNRHIDGIISVRSGMRELEMAGYLRRFRVYENGKIVRWDWEFDLQRGFLQQQNLLQGYLPAGNRPLSNIERSKLITEVRKRGNGRGPKSGPLPVPPSLNLEPPKATPIPKYAKAVEVFARFSVEKNWHHLHNHKNGRPVRGATKKGWTRQTLDCWQREYLELKETLQDIPRIKSVMLWFMSHAEEGYVPCAQTFTVFVKKFDKIEFAMRRDAQDKAEAHRRANGEAEASPDDYAPISEMQRHNIELERKARARMARSGKFSE